MWPPIRPVLRERRDLASAPLGLSVRRRTCRCGPSVPQPSKWDEASRCISPRRSPSASPIRSPVHASSAIRNRSLARSARAITAAICSEPRSW